MLNHERFSDAVAWAARLHAGQTRKGTEIPYISHVLAVSSLVLEDGGTEDEAIAALLHDVIEDCGVTQAEVADLFDRPVAEIVWACTDTDQDPKPEWKPRKEAYLEHLRVATSSVLRVSAADKLHNVRSMIDDYGLVGDALWDRFTPKNRGETLWFYRSVADILNERLIESTLPRRLAAAVDQLETASGGRRQG